MDVALIEMTNVAKRILGPDNNDRREAETIFEQMKTSPSIFFITLLRMMQHGDSLHVRLFAAVILRQQLMPRFTLWDQLDAQSQAAIREELCKSFTVENTPVMRRKISDVIAALATRTLANITTEEAIQLWPQLIQLILQGINVPDDAVQEATYDLITKLAEYSPAILVPELSNLFVQMRTTVMNDSVTLRVRYCICRAAAQIYISFFDDAEAAPATSAFSEFLSIILDKVIEPATATTNNAIIEDMLSVLQEVARISPRFFLKSTSEFERVVKLFASIADKTEIYDPTLCRHSFTLLISIGLQTKFTVRKVEVYGPILFTLLIKYLSIVDHDSDQSWERVDQSELFFNDDDENEFHSYAISILSQLATIFGPRDLLARLYGPASKLIASNDWKHQLAGFSIFATLSPDCVKSMTKHTTQLCKIISTVLSSPPANVHPRVRFAAVNLFAQLALDQGRKFAVSNTGMLPLVIDHLDHTKYFPRIISWTCLCLVDFLGSLSPTTVNKFSSDILNRCITLLGLNMNGISINALSLIASVAVVIEEKFIPYYDVIISGLIQLLSSIPYNSDDNSLRELRGKSIECIGLIAKSVGKEVFLRNVDSIMETIFVGSNMCMVEYTKDGLPSASSRNEYTLRCFENIASTLGSDFSKYLPNVIPSLLECAGMENLFHQFDLTEDGKPLYSDVQQIEALERAGYTSMDLTIRGHGMRKAVVNTTLIQEKIIACELLSQFAVDMKENFIPHLDAAAAILFPLCTFRINPRVRTAAVSSVCALVDVAVSAVNKNGDAAGATVDQKHALLRDFWRRACDALQSAAEIETTDGISSILLSFAAAIDTLPFSLDSEELHTLRSFVIVPSMQAIQRKKDRLNKVNSEGPNADAADEEDEDGDMEANDIDNTILESASILNCSLVKNHADVYVPIFSEHVAPTYITMLTDTTCDDFTRMTSIITFADIIENGGTQSIVYCEKLTPIFIENSCKQDHQLRRGACFGIKAVLQQVGAQYQPYVQKSLEACIAACHIQDENDIEDCEAATDNALAAIGRLLDGFGGGKMVELTNDMEQAIRGEYIKLLPRRMDDDETPEIHARFAAWMKEGNNHTNPAYQSIAKQIIKLYQDDSSIATPEIIQLLSTMIQQ